MLSNVYEQFTAMLARLQAEDGQSMAEYAILITVIAVVVLGAAALLGTNISSVFTSLAGKL